MSGATSSMIRDLTEISIEMTRQDKSDEIAEKAELNVEERILDLLLPPPRSASIFTTSTPTRTKNRQPISIPRRVMNSFKKHAKSFAVSYVAASSIIASLSSKSEENR